MANLKRGSSGDEVKQLQQALINAGYNVGSTGADGSYGPATRDAVTQYQKDHGLAVDGMAGPETQGSLYGTASSGGGSTGGGSSGGSFSGGGGGSRDYTGTTYQSNDYHGDAISAAQSGDWDKVWEALNNREIVTNSLGTNYGKTSMDIYNELLAQYGGPQNEMDELYAMLADLQQQMSRPVQAYTPSWGDEAYEQLLQQAIAMNYDDWTQSEQYKSLANRYGAQGKMTMQDVLGQISSRTGGLASSYATTAANQQYNEYMSQLEEVARQMFAGERGDLIENAGLARDYGEYEYGRYLDQLNQQAQQNSYALDIINQMMGYQADKENTQYNRGQNAKAEAQDRVNAYLAANGALGGLDADLISTSGYTQGELAALEQYYADQRAAEAAKAKGNGSGDTKNSPDYSNVRKKAMSYDDLSEAEAYLNRMVDGGKITEDEAYNIYMVDLGGNPTAEPEAVVSVPTTYEEFTAKTGNASIMTATEFARAKSSGAGRASGHENYQDYLAAMWEKHKPN